MQDPTAATSLLDDSTQRTVDALTALLPAASVCVLDADLRIRHLSGPGLPIVGLAPRVLLGRTVDEVCHALGIPTVASTLQRAVAGEAVRLEARGHTYDVAAGPLPLATTAAALVMVRDVTAALVEQAQRQDRDTLLAVVAHELRQPLAALAPAVTALQRGASPEVSERLLRVLARQLAHMRRLVENLADTALLQAGRLGIKLGEVELSAVLTDLMDTARQAADRHFELLADGPVYVRGDLGRLQQIFGNLLFNAVRHTADGGSVVVVVTREEECAVVSIIDDGDGIPPALLPHIFDLFKQGEARAGRMGIGLHLVRGLVERQGGQVEARSAGPGMGATLMVALPLVGAPSAACAAEPPAPAAALPS